MATHAAAVVEEVYRADWGRIVATLIRLVGDFDLAEDSAQEAFAAAVKQWPEQGIPDLPRAWIIQTARNKAIDRIRRRETYYQKLTSYVASGLVRDLAEPDYDTDEIPDDRLRLIFTCCHPALALEAQVALTLRTLCGLETDQIARAFLPCGARGPVPLTEVVVRRGSLLRAGSGARHERQRTPVPPSATSRSQCSGGVCLTSALHPDLWHKFR